MDIDIDKIQVDIQSLMYHKTLEEIELFILYIKSKLSFRANLKNRTSDISDNNLWLLSN